MYPRTAFFLLASFLSGLVSLPTSAQISPHPLPDNAAAPLLDTPMRSPAITRAPDGTFYLTGTVASTSKDGSPDFLNNDGVYLWKSSNLKTWTPLGKVWALDIVADRGGETRWTQYTRLNPANPDGPWVRGVQSPELHFHKGKPFIAFAMSGGGTGLLASTSGKPEGPYAVHSRLTTTGGTPSLFVDSADSAYWLWDGGWICRLDEDLKKLEGKPVFLRPEPESALGDWPAHVGASGAFLFEHDGKFNLVATDITPRLGAACRDTFVARADSPMGPYGTRRIMIPHGGEVTLFNDDKGQIWSTFGGDPQATFQNRAGIVPLVDDGFLHNLHLQRPTKTEGIPVSSYQPLSLREGGRPLPESGSASIRDPQVLLAPDGFYYLTGTTSKNELRAPGLRIWRSKDLVEWTPLGDEHGVVWYVDETEWTSKPFQTDAVPEHPVHDFWAPEIHFIKGNYYIPFCMFGGGSGMLRSKTGKPEGPYEDWTGRLHTWAGDPSLFVDDDGSVYMHLGFGPTQLVKMTDDLRGFDGEPFVIGPSDGSILGHEGGYLAKMDGKYVFFYTTLNGEEEVERKAKARPQQFSTYDFMYCWADNLRGPFSRPRVAVPHGGHGAVFQDRDGNWMGTMFGTTRHAPFHGRLAIFPLDVKFEDGDLHIAPAPQNPAR